MLRNDAAPRSPTGQREELSKALGCVAGDVLKMYVENLPKGMALDVMIKIYLSDMAMSCGHSREDATT